MRDLKIPDGYGFPKHVAIRSRDFKLCWFLLMEVGVASIPPTEFYSDKYAHIGESFLRFAVSKDDDVLAEAKMRLRGLQKYVATDALMMTT